MWGGVVRVNPICFLLPSFDTWFLFWFCLKILYKFVSLWFHRRHKKVVRILGLLIVLEMCLMFA